ncbi:MAG: preprotein translocase subunit Sec61beta [Candidatus Diapherotrites archaeon]|nr:preprotein translocase subunit Sec61beta [Candidatus Diapherotrites archaeon]
MKFNKTRQSGAGTGPSSSIGIMHFFESDSGPKIPPTAIVIFAGLFVLVVVILKLFKIA